MQRPARNTAWLTDGKRVYAVIAEHVVVLLITQLGQTPRG